MRCTTTSGRSTTDGDWNGWLTFFLEVIEHQARDAVTRSARLQELRDDYRARVATARSSGLLGVLVDALFDTPALTIPQARALLHVTHRAAAQNVAKLVEAGIVGEIGDQSRNKVFLASDVVRAVEGLPATGR